MTTSITSSIVKALPPRPIVRLTASARRFLKIEAASGVILFVCTLLALLVANTPMGPIVHDFWQTNLRFGIGHFHFDHSLHFWVNDGLMTIFFFVMGLEIKRELVDGELSTLQKAALPIIGALGGMIVPTAIFMVWHPSGPNSRGWGIPMATDIAFVIGVLALFGPRVPSGLKIFLLSLAIVDDIGAVLMIASFYSTDPNLLALAAGAGALGLVYMFLKLGARSIWIYILLGVLTWFAVLESGVHPTIAGVLLGLLTPARPWLDDKIWRKAVVDVIADREKPLDLPEANLLVFVAREAVSPLHRIEAALHPWVGFVVMPLFALANAGVEVRGALAADPLALAIAVSLLVGKTAGIFGFCWLAVRFGFAQRPVGVTGPMLFAASVLGGIGFTMSLFVAALAFPDASGPQEAAKTGILIGSGMSLAIGVLLLSRTLGRPRHDSALTTIRSKSDSLSSDM